MQLHTTSGRWIWGFILAVLTSILWAVLPIKLKSIIAHMDGITITFYRFCISGIFLLIYLVGRKKFLPAKKLKKIIIISLFFTAALLTLNYVTYAISLTYLSPSTATVVIQLAPVFMLFGSIIIFKEHFSLTQWMGFGVLLLGLCLFFNDRISELFVMEMNEYLLGVILVIIAALSWAAYALLQKQLLRYFTSEQIMVIIYICGIFFLLPLSQPKTIIHLDKVGLFLLILCGLNTLLAYGFFAESLNHWEASRISMILATIPITTILLVKWSHTLFPSLIEPEFFNGLSIFGSFLVVLGSMICSLK